MNSYVYSYLMFFLQGLLESYFLCNYLYSDDKKKAFMISQLFLCILQHPSQMLLFQVQGIKLLIYILVLYLIVFTCFRKNSLKHKLLSVVLLMLIITIVEVIVIYFMMVTTGIPEEISTANPHPIYIYLFQCLLMYVFTKAVLVFFNKQLILNKKEFLIFLSLSLLKAFGLTVLVVNVTKTTFNIDAISITVINVGLIVLSVISYCLMFLYLMKRHQKQQKELTFLMLQKEYEEQLDYCLKQIQQQSDIRMLRHDLINYIQSQKE